MASTDPKSTEETKPTSSNPSGMAKVTRRATGAGEYFRNTILANVERLAGDAAVADEKERLARIGYQQMRGRSEEHTHTPPISDHPGSFVPPANEEPAKPGLKN
ncbi:hypothetical protein TWF718_002835 [Orbilia javanica]|uniref:Uncharacterized protein n=1 Tax=Orbilia javanica TaxID=47235 RepID=A0AAN8MT32_9PEZI